MGGWQCFIVVILCALRWCVKLCNLGHFSMYKVLQKLIIATHAVRGANPHTD